VKHDVELVGPEARARRRLTPSQVVPSSLLG
jgi:hypothetical protein